MVNSFLRRGLRQFNGERIIFSINGAGITGYPHAKRKELNPYRIPYTKITSKWIIHLNSKLKTIKLLAIRQWFHRYDTKSIKCQKKKIDKLDCIRIKSFCFKRHLQNGRKYTQIIYLIHIYPACVKNYISIIKIQITQLKNRQQIFVGISPEKDIQIANIHMLNIISH